MNKYTIKKGIFNMKFREQLIEQGVHVNDDIDNYVGHVSRDYDVEEHESYAQVAK